MKEHLGASLSTILALYSPIKVCQVNGYEDMLWLNVVCGGGCFIANSGWKLDTMSAIGNLGFIG